MTDDTATLLDLPLAIDDRSINSWVYHKPTDSSNNYSLFSLSHQPSSKNYLPYSQLLRIKHSCSIHANFIIIFNPVTNHYSACKYTKYIIESANNKGQSINREIIPKTSSKKNSMDCIHLIFKINPSIHPLSCIIMKHYKTHE